MKKILFLDFDGVLFDTVEEAYQVSINTKVYRNVKLPPNSLNKFREYRCLVGPAWNYYYVMKAILDEIDLKNNTVFIESNEAKNFEKDFFESRKNLKLSNYKFWLNLNKQYLFFEKLQKIEKSLDILIYIITTKDKQTVQDLLDEFKIDFINRDFILGKDSFDQYGSKKNIILQILKKDDYKAIFVDDLYEHLKLCEGIENLQLIQADWGYIDEVNSSQYLSNIDKTIHAIQKL